MIKIKKSSLIIIRFSETKYLILQLTTILQILLSLNEAVHNGHYIKKLLRHQRIEQFKD